MMLRTKHAMALAGAVVMCIALQAEAQVLAVSGEVKKPLNLSVADFAKLSRQSVQANIHGRNIRYEGVLLITALRAAGAPLGEELRGANLALYVCVEGRDGYKAVFSLAELDEAFGNQKVLVADMANGKPLTEEEGPLRLVVPEDTRQGRWVRMLKAIRVGRAE